MREERIGIGGLDDFGRAADGLIGIAVDTDVEGRRLLRDFVRFGKETGARLLGRRAVLPDHFELGPRALGLPPAIGHDGDAGH